MNKFRVLSLIDVGRVLDKALERHIVSVPNGITPSCLSCEHFNEDRESCAISDYQRPPARIIAFGCERYKDNDPIPF